ncbi:hypothetical protein L6164_006535 [Bauhinia variegata]|uniref:Uncharacterized protein n=1 Tax=Bauhinia variegata TaxID=167791 RepID=A0ACB9PUT1_BAUVA|nr:hypothetical protein L6164_006535 [Bauhinia variegata]
MPDEDVDKLKACIELGFEFECSPEVELDQHLSDTLPTLGLYLAVNKNYNDSLLVSNVTTSSSSSSTVFGCETPSPLGSPHTAETMTDKVAEIAKNAGEIAKEIAFLYWGS